MGLERLTNMTSKQIDKKTTKQVRIDTGLHQSLKIYAAESKMSIKDLLEDYLSDLLAMDKPDVYVFKQKTRPEPKKRIGNRAQIEQFEKKTI